MCCISIAKAIAKISMILQATKTYIKNIEQLIFFSYQHYFCKAKSNKGFIKNEYYILKIEAFMCYDELLQKSAVL